jgi:hypothetical protein
MLRITVELVPFGSEALTHTISEFCVANVGGDSAVADYKFAGYQVGREDKKISEFAGEVKKFGRAEGVLRLLDLVLASEKDTMDSDEFYELLLGRTRLAQEENEDEQID